MHASNSGHRILVVIGRSPMAELRRITGESWCVFSVCGIVATCFTISTLKQVRAGVLHQGTWSYINIHRYVHRKCCTAASGGGSYRENQRLFLSLRASEVVVVNSKPIDHPLESYLVISFGIYLPSSAFPVPSTCPSDICPILLLNHTRHMVSICIYTAS